LKRKKTCRGKNLNEKGIESEEYRARPEFALIKEKVFKKTNPFVFATRENCEAHTTIERTI
jgi:hypothetical protein